METTAQADRRKGMVPPQTLDGRRGVTLFETCASVALVSLAAAGLLAGTRPLACALRVEAARSILVGALVEARREAYLRESTFAVRTPAGAAEVFLHDRHIRPLGDGVILTSVPADENILFHASGLADNATVRVACGRATASVIVNQRGVIR